SVSSTLERTTSSTWFLSFPSSTRSAPSAAGVSSVIGGLTHGLVRWFLVVPINQIEATASNVRRKRYLIPADSSARRGSFRARTLQGQGPHQSPLSRMGVIASSKAGASCAHHP